jgi:chloramphenicol O-acetyltransferase type A
MSEYLDIQTWNRKQLFDFFIGYKNPHFNICTNLDITKLREFVRSREVKISLALHYLSLRVANEIEPFRYRLKQDNRVFIHDVINGGTTVLMPDESFSYAYFDYVRDFDSFIAGMGKAVEDVVTGDGKLRPTMRDDVIYHTTLPWISFTSFSHARNTGRGESIPRIVFGKFSKTNDRVMMPFSVEVHHALMDGLQVGRYLARMEEALEDPETFVKPV